VRAALAKPVPQPFFDACCSLCFNIGQANFAHSSIVRLANAGDLPRAVEAFLMWDRPAAIISRRQGERDQAALAAYGTVYARHGDPAPVRATEGPTPAAPPRPDPLAPMTGTTGAALESWWLRLRDAIRVNMQKGA
jgi:lysozyme